jgi:transposase
VISVVHGAVLLRVSNHGKVVGTSEEKEFVLVISKETEAEILRLHYAEKWRKNTIAVQLNIHHATVERVLVQNGVSAEQLRVRASIADPFIEFIKANLKDYPKLNATRLYYMAKDRGYPGGVDHFRDIVARYRPRTAVSASLRLRTLPGEQAQVDWGHFGKIEIEGTERKLYGYVMTLSWSRHIFLRFYVNQGTANFQRGHIDAFEFFGGLVPRELLYDNLKSVVLERIGKAIHFNPAILELASHYRFKPVPVEPRAPEQKGRVERGIKFVRSSFWQARKFASLEDLNEQALKWCMREAGERRWVQDRKLTVLQAFEEEKANLLSVPLAPYMVYDRLEVSVGKTPYVRFDCNDYSVPGEYVRKTLSVFATPSTVKICDGNKEVACHKRSYAKGKPIEDQSHLQELIEAKRTARKHRAMDRLQLAAPSTTELLCQAGLRGHNLGRLTQQLTSLLDLYGAGELEQAVKDALAGGAAHASAVKQALETRRSQRGGKLPVRLRFEGNPQANELTVPPKSLQVYDSLLKQGEGND